VTMWSMSSLVGVVTRAVMAASLGLIAWAISGMLRSTYNQTGTSLKKR